jgi:hypothetical protein
MWRCMSVTDAKAPLRQSFHDIGTLSFQSFCDQAVLGVGYNVT